MSTNPISACRCCRISPSRFLAECRKRRLNQGSFVSLCFALFAFSALCFVSVLCVFLAELTNGCTYVSLAYVCLSSITYVLWPLIEKTVWSSNRKLPMRNRMVTWPMTSRPWKVKVMTPIRLGPVCRKKLITIICCDLWDSMVGYLSDSLSSC